MSSDHPASIMSRMISDVLRDAGALSDDNQIIQGMVSSSIMRNRPDNKRATSTIIVPINDSVRMVAQISRPPEERLLKLVSNYLLQPDPTEYLDNSNKTSPQESAVRAESSETGRFISVPMPLELSMNVLDDNPPDINPDSTDNFLRRLKKDFPPSVLYKFSVGERKLSTRKQRLLNCINYIHKQFKVVMKEHEAGKLFLQVHGNFPLCFLCQEYEAFAHFNQQRPFPKIKNLSTLEEIIELEYQGFGFLSEQTVEPRKLPSVAEELAFEEELPWWIVPGLYLSEWRGESGRQSKFSLRRKGIHLGAHGNPIAHHGGSTAPQPQDSRSEEQSEATASTSGRKKKLIPRCSYKVYKKRAAKSSLRLTIKKIHLNQKTMTKP